VLWEGGGTNRLTCLYHLLLLLLLLQVCPR
jgi:hypothetical protein